jgi:hypothetical protein
MALSRDGQRGIAIRVRQDGRRLPGAGHRPHRLLQYRVDQQKFLAIFLQINAIDEDRREEIR